MPPLTAAEAMREAEVAAELHTSVSDVGGASSMSMLCGPASCRLPSLECPEWALAPGDWPCGGGQPITLKQHNTSWRAASSLDLKVTRVRCVSKREVTFTSAASGFFHSDISLESNSSALSLTSLKGLTSPPTTL